MRSLTKGVKAMQRVHDPSRFVKTVPNRGHHCCTVLFVRYRPTGSVSVTPHGVGLEMTCPLIFLRFRPRGAGFGRYQEGRKKRNQPQGVNSNSGPQLSPTHMHDPDPTAHSAE